MDQQLAARVRRHVSCGYVEEHINRRDEPALYVSGVGAVTFEVMAALSEEFGTKLIDVSCETGTGSDPCHERALVIRGRTR